MYQLHLIAVDGRVRLHFARPASLSLQATCRHVFKFENLYLYLVVCDLIRNKVVYS